MNHNALYSKSVRVPNKETNNHPPSILRGGELMDQAAAAACFMRRELRLSTGDRVGVLLAGTGSCQSNPSIFSFSHFLIFSFSQL
jgi:hypothetical protein